MTCDVFSFTFTLCAIITPLNQLLDLRLEDSSSSVINGFANFRNLPSDGSMEGGASGNEIPRRDSRHKIYHDSLELLVLYLSPPPPPPPSNIQEDRNSLSAAAATRHPHQAAPAAAANRRLSGPSQPPRPSQAAKEQQSQNAAAALHGGD